MIPKLQSIFLLKPKQLDNGSNQATISHDFPPIFPIRIKEPVRFDFGPHKKELILLKGRSMSAGIQRVKRSALSQSESLLI